MRGQLNFYGGGRGLKWNMITTHPHSIAENNIDYCQCMIIHTPTVQKNKAFDSIFLKI